MKILIDINHPAHVHYFRNFIKIMEDKGHTVKVINRDSPMINRLLDSYQIEHKIRNRRPVKKSVSQSLLYLMGVIWHCIKASISFRPDMYIGFASSACAVTSCLFGKPCVLIDDTEHNNMNHRLYKPFCSVVLTPFYFTKGLGKKQIYFKAYVEQLYLHSNYFSQSEDVLHELTLNPQEYVLVRYIAYDAHHDLNIRPLSEDAKKNMVKRLSEKYRVLLSMENETTDSFYKDYLIKVPPEKMHDMEANAKFMVTEGATMASESFVHGVPYVYMNPLRCGNINYQTGNYPERAFQSCDEVEINEYIDRLSSSNIDNTSEKKEIEKDTIDPTAFFVWFIENYPQSETIMREDPDYQNRFKQSVLRAV